MITLSSTGATDGEEALALTAEHRPDVVLMDLRMPRMDGIEATGRLRERQPDVRVIALTTYADDESVLGALRAGARGYLTKDASSHDIHTAILTVAAGDAALDPTVQNHVIAALAHDTGGSAGSGVPTTPELPDDLTPREAEVLALIALGLTNAEIAERLVVSPTTVKSHINHLFAKARPARPHARGQLRLPHGIATPPT
jgi:DNA-binding NarL/FixJ family response regulator